jgi:hypothetical protein
VAAPKKLNFRLKFGFDKDGPDREGIVNRTDEIKQGIFRTKIGWLLKGPIESQFPFRDSKSRQGIPPVGNVRFRITSEPGGRIAKG